MRGPWSRKTPQFISITPVDDKTSAAVLGKAKRVQIKVASEKTTIVKGN
jgi:hypothetical protein